MRIEPARGSTVYAAWSPATGGGQARPARWGQSSCGQGHTLSPPKFAHSFPGLAGLPASFGFSHSRFAPPTGPYRMIRPIAGTTTTSTVPLLSRYDSGHPWYAVFSTETGLAAGTSARIAVVNASSVGRRIAIERMGERVGMAGSYRTARTERGPNNASVDVGCNQMI